jgi:tyrosyl-tRNA synthetase
MTDAEIERQLAVFRAGTVDLVSEDELARKLRRGRPLRIKYGNDPSAPNLHLGHSVVLDKLRELQDLGHQVIFLVGDFTAMIGDPTGRSRTRPALSREEVARNARTYADQVGLVLDTARAEIRFNSEWLDALTPADVIRLASHQSVARMLERDDFQRRYRSGASISLHEFLYPLVQAYDSVALRADVELGGTDQLFNLLLGREIQRDYGQEPQIVVTLPLLEGTDGSEKMSKSLGNAIALTDSPDEMYGRTMSIPDAVLLHWVALLGRCRGAALASLRDAVASGSGNPRDLKAALARMLVARYHGEENASAAEERFDRLFRRREAPEAAAEIAVRAAPGAAGIPLVELVERAGLAASRSAAKRLVAQGGVRLDGERAGDPFQVVGLGTHLLQAGRRRAVQVRLDRESPSKMGS